MNHLAICFFGQVKNYNNLLYKLFTKHITDSLSQKYIIDYFIVTYNNSYYFRPSTKENHPIDYKSINKYFIFTQKVILDTNCESIKNLDTWVEKTLSKCGYTKDWGNESELLTKHGIRQLYGLKKIYEILSSLNTSYAKYLFCRPDCLFEKPLDNQILSTKYNICIPNFNHWNGYNDRFAILDTQGLKTYCSRYDHLIVNPQTYHSEKYLKYTIDNSYNTLKLFDNFKFRLLRSNNKLSPIDY